MKAENDMDTKKEIRKEILSLRDAVLSEYRRDGNKKIKEHMMRLPCYRDADVILAYVSYRSEVDTMDLIRQAFTDGKQVFAPKVAGDEMEFWQLSGLDALQSGYQGILEPIETLSYPAYSMAKKSKEQKISVLMWMPGAVFDRMCHRIGYGKGFYDKYLDRLYNKSVIQCGNSDVELTTVALAYECQVLEQIPCEPHDYRPDFILTECGLIEKNVYDK